MGTYAYFEDLNDIAERLGRDLTPAEYDEWAMYRFGFSVSELTKDEWTDLEYSQYYETRSVLDRIWARLNRPPVSDDDGVKPPEWLAAVWADRG